MTERVSLLACGVFKEEFARLPEDLKDSFQTRFLDSMLHMRPEVLDRLLAASFESAPRKTVLLYGDCSPHMREFAARSGCFRTQGINCIEICLGKPRYRKLRAEGAFFLMPEWAVRWERVFKEELGLKDPELARGFMRESATELVYVDTGGGKPPGSLEDAVQHLGLPLRLEAAGVWALERALRDALSRVRDA